MCCATGWSSRCPREEWDLVIRVHLRGHFITTRFATAYWRERSKATGGPVYARIINTSSEAFLLGSAGQPNYAAAKAGIVGADRLPPRAAARRYGVRANAICPRARTAMTAELMGPRPTRPPTRCRPAHVAPLVTYLAGPAAARITGEVFVVHGGVVAVLAPPTVRASFRTDGEPWSAGGLHDVLGAAVHRRSAARRASSARTPLARSADGHRSAKRARRQVGGGDDAGRGDRRLLACPHARCSWRPSTPTAPRTW